MGGNPGHQNGAVNRAQTGDLRTCRGSARRTPLGRRTRWLASAPRATRALALEPLQRRSHASSYRLGPLVPARHHEVAGLALVPAPRQSAGHCSRASRRCARDAFCGGRAYSAHVPDGGRREPGRQRFQDPGLPRRQARLHDSLVPARYRGPRPESRAPKARCWRGSAP